MPIPSTTSTFAAITAAAAAATTTTAESTTAATTGAFFLGPGFIDGQGATVVLNAVQGGNRRGGFAVGGHFNKPETFASTGVAIVDDLRGNHLPMSGKELLESRAVQVVTEIPHVQFLTHLKISC
jgi:hypothetical protein